MLETVVFENYRLFDEEDNFQTELLCSFCDKPSELYSILTIGLIELKICKTCLTREIEKISESFINHCLIGRIEK